MSMKDIARSGAEGNMRLLKEYGGHSNGSGTKKCFAHGGHVHSDEAQDKKLVKGMVKGDCLKRASGGTVDGMPSKGRLDRPGRKAKGKGKGGTNVNVIIMPKGNDAPPMAGPAGPGPMPPPPHPMPAPPGPPMAGGPPMPPMHKHGGKVSAYKHGGHVKHRKNGGHLDAEGQTDPTEREAEREVTAKKHGGKVHKANGGHIHADGQDSKTESEAESKVEGRKHGGHVKHHKREGGPVEAKMKYGAGSGEGRLEKIKDYGRK